MTIPTADSPFRFVVSATFTAEPLRPVIAFWGPQLNSHFDIRFAPYNQIAQSLLDPGSELRSNNHGVNIVLARLEDLGQFEQGAPDALPRLEENVHALAQQIRDAAPLLTAPLIFCLCPSSPTFLDTPDRQAFKKRMLAFLSAALDQTPGVQLLHYEQIDRLYPVDGRHDPEADRLAKIPYTELYFCALGTALVRYTHALLLPPFKVVALDCDNTLWRGICGEDGPENVQIDPPRRALQEFMVDQRESGMLLTLASKNNEQDVLDTFAAHPEMPLNLRHFVSWRLNWDSKADNLIALSDELGLGLDSFVFVDDNPKECAEVDGSLPQVLALALPDPIERTPEFLKHVWAFDHPVVTEEDQNRSAYYAQQQEFGAEAHRAASLEEFIASLDLRVSIYPNTMAKLPRTAQLTQRTNQFNLTTIRRTEAEIQSLDDEVYTLDVSDRFGDYGQTGVIICKAEGQDLLIDTFLLSCRVLGRGVEHRVAAWLGEQALSRGLPNVVFRYERTPKNAPARDFAESIENGEKTPDANGFVLRIPSAHLAKLQWKAPKHAHEKPVPTLNATKSQRRTVDYACIARDLASAGSILRAMRASHTPAELAEEMTETEEQLARIWADLLGRTTVSRGDNFFDLGGHSLIAVLLLLRIRETFGVELSIDDVYSGTLTLADLAARIETAQLSGVDPEEYAALLAEIEGMSDEEARQLLATEDPRELMRVLLTSNASYDPPRGGSTRSNLIWLKHLAESGHECRIICPTDGDAPDAHSTIQSGLDVYGVQRLSRRTGILSDHIQRFQPDWALVSSEDLSHVLLREASKTAADRLVYLAHTPQWYPFGPASWYADAQATRIVRQAAGVVAISHAMASYIEAHCGARPAVIHPPMYGQPPYPRFGSFDQGYILMVNPSVVKGIAIFLALAERFPDTLFAGLTGWGTTRRDREAMAALPNVRILESVPSIDDVLSKSRLLLMPSLWLEGFGLIAMEAMLRGLPVIASDSGGLVEAKAGTGFVIPVRPLEKFEPVFDETNMPKPVEVPQNIEPWAEALRSLLADRALYQAESDRSRDAALRFVSQLRASDFESYLSALRPAAIPTDAASDLSAAKRALLLKRLRGREKK